MIGEISWHVEHYSFRVADPFGWHENIFRRSVGICEWDCYLHWQFMVGRWEHERVAQSIRVIG